MLDFIRASYGRPVHVPPWRLVVASGLMLFVELALIRWTGSNVLHLSYFSNFVLLARSSASGWGSCAPGTRGTCPDGGR